MRERLRLAVPNKGRLVDPTLDLLNRIGGEVGADELRTALATMRQLIAIIEASRPALEE